MVLLKEETLVVLSCNLSCKMLSFLIFLTCLFIGSHGDSVDDNDTISIQTRVLGGKNVAKVGDLPYHANFWDIHHPNTRCGMTIINEHWAVSVAHCWYIWKGKPTDFQVSVGITNKKNVPADHRVSIEKVIMHPGYKMGSTNMNDIALIKVKGSLIKKGQSAAAKLPGKNDNFVGKTAIASGWGSDIGGRGKSDQLMMLEMPILPNEKCEQVYGTKRGKGFNKDMHICAGHLEGGSGSCQGSEDSGSPLVVREANGFKSVGMTSWGPFPCGLPNHPNVYTKVSYFLDWINETMKKEGL